MIQNLRISKLEFRTDESLDVAKYSNKKQVECLPVKLSYAILNIRTQFLEVSVNWIIIIFNILNSGAIYSTKYGNI